MSRVETSMLSSIFTYAIWIALVPVARSSMCVNIARGRSVFQSSVLSTQYASKAVDGRTESGFSYCAHTADTNTDDDSWLVVDLVSQYQVGHVVVTNRNVLGRRLNNFIVGLTNDFTPPNSPQRGAYTICGQYPGAAPDGARMTVRCNSTLPQFRYVIIQQPEDGMGYLTICELQVYKVNDTGSPVNLALGKPAYQSSNFNNAWKAGKAVDGSTSDCSHTWHRRDQNPWFAVDLGQAYVIHRVRLTKPGSEMTQFVVEVTNNFTRGFRRSSVSICGRYLQSIDNERTATVTCDPTPPPSRYVILQLPENSTAGRLVTCELEVYSNDINATNLARGRPAFQSSTWEVSRPSVAVDGQTSVSTDQCAHTMQIADLDPWFLVDLGKTYQIEAVSILNRGDCCGERMRSFHAGITNNVTIDPAGIRLPPRGSYPVCGPFTGVPANGAKLTVGCPSNAAPGRFVLVRLPEGANVPLTICEIEIFERTAFDVIQPTTTTSPIDDKDDDYAYGDNDYDAEFPTSVINTMSQFSKVTVRVGETAELACDAMILIPCPKEKSFWWFHQGFGPNSTWHTKLMPSDGTRITMANTSSVSSNSSQMTLFIRNVTKAEDEGQYVCVPNSCFLQRLWIMKVFYLTILDDVNSSAIAEPMRNEQSPSSDQSSIVALSILFACSIIIILLFLGYFLRKYYIQNRTPEFNRMMDLNGE